MAVAVSRDCLLCVTFLGSEPVSRCRACRARRARRGSGPRVAPPSTTTSGRHRPRVGVVLVVGGAVTVIAAALQTGSTADLRALDVDGTVSPAPRCGPGHSDRQRPAQRCATRRPGGHRRVGVADRDRGRRDRALARRRTPASLQVSVDGSRAALVRPDSAPNTWLVTSPSGTAPHSMEVSYRLDGAIVRREPSVDGRALACSPRSRTARSRTFRSPSTWPPPGSSTSTAFTRPRQPRSCAASSTGTTGR